MLVSAVVIICKRVLVQPSILLIIARHCIVYSSILHRIFQYILVKLVIDKHFCIVDINS